MAEFDLSALMKDVSKPDTGREQIEYIGIDLIDPDPDNFYSLEGLEELAGNIEMLGLQQPLRVRPIKGGRYVVISGHRRRAAILLIRDGGSDQFTRGVPCIVDRSEASDALRELKLIMANSDTRKMTSADQNRQAERIEDLLRQLEDEGFEFPGRLRDWVAKLSGMSRTKLARLKVIREKLIPELASDYEAGRVSETVAYALAQQTEKIQAFIRRSYFIEDLTEDDVKNIAQMRQSKAAPKRDDIDATKDIAKGKPPADSTVFLPPKTAYRRRTSIRDAAHALGLDPTQSIQETMERLERYCRSWRGCCGPGYDVECRRGKIILDAGTRYERHYTLRAFIELAAEMWIEDELPQVFAGDQPKQMAIANVWYDADEGDLPDEDYDIANMIAWGSAGLATIPGVSFAKAHAIMPERYRWWSYVMPPEKVEAEDT